MRFKFSYLCDLLQALDDNRVKKKASHSRAKDTDGAIIISWFNKHHSIIPRHGPPAVAFLSCMFPERRADRVYNTQEKRLERIIGRTLFLSTTRMAHLASWRTGHGTDFPQSVQNVMAEAEFPKPRPDHEVTLEEIDATFDRIAAAYNGSSPELRARFLDPQAADESLPPLFRRLQSTEAKWLVRMFLKRYTPIELPERLVLRQFHFLLPDVLNLQNCFTAAVECLVGPTISRLTPRPQNEEHEKFIRLEAAKHLKPQIGVMIQRSPYHKARSIQNCCDMAARKRISVERKYDGEYCQVHVDISKGKAAIKIFSKSGKDSTLDRVRLHGAIEDTLKLGKKDCLIKSQCILEGELLIWHEKEQRIMPFDKIRKHVTRNGRFLGNDQDSPRDLNENLMIMFYDLLLLDDIVCLSEPLEQRRSRLRSIIRRIPGKAELGYREKINFASRDAKELVRQAFAKCISRGWEGFVLKGCDDPYFSLTAPSRCIKLKKDYISGLGDVADLAVIGGRRDARDVHTLGMGNLNWTTFYLGSLENGNEVRRFAARPQFRIVGLVSATKGTIAPDRTRLINERGQFERIPYTSIRAEMEVINDQMIDPPTDLFKNPFVVEAIGGGFVKPPNETYYTLRFPRITKIHEDRSWHNTMSFEGLQQLAQESLTMAQNEDSQEDREWIERLIQADPKSKFVNEHSASTDAGRTPGSRTTATMTPDKHRVSMSPLLVRIDTQELTAEERRERMRSGDASVISIHSSRTSSRTLSKRKAMVHDSGSCAATSTKRIRLSPIGPSGKEDFLAETSSSPSGKPQSQMTLTSCRQPLREIQSPATATKSTSTRAAGSPTHATARDEVLPPAAMMQSPPQRNYAEKRELEPGLTSLHPKHLVPHPTASTGPPLPTPPSTRQQDNHDEPERADQAGQTPDLSRTRPETEYATSRSTDDNCVRFDKGKTTLVGQDVHLETDPAPAAVPIPKPRAKFACQLSTNLIVSQLASTVRGLPIFLSPCLSHLPSEELTSLLSFIMPLRSTFTFSREVLLDFLPANPSKTLIAIVKIADSEGTGRAIAASHRALHRRVQAGLVKGEGKLVFLHWKVLQLWPGKDGSTGGLKKWFAGCLIWNSNGVRDVWDWREAFNKFHT
jgi:DNA ligase 4